RLLDVLDDGQIRWRPLLVDAVADEHAEPEPSRLGGRLLDQARLADAGLADEQQEGARPLACALHGAKHPRALRAARDEGRARRPREDAGALRIRPRHLPETPGG